MLVSADAQLLDQIVAEPSAADHDSSLVVNQGYPVLKLNRINVSTGIMLPMDTLIDANYHLPEADRSSVLRYATLGSPNAASYRLLYDDANPIGYQLGYRQYDHLYQDRMALNVVATNRSIFDIQYQQAAHIGSKDLRGAFYRRFADDVLLNFKYDQSSDNSYRGNQENEWSYMDIKLYQNAEKQQSYFIYQRHAHLAEQARTLSRVSLGNSEKKRTRLLIGHRRALSQDSIGMSKMWHTQLSRTGDRYGLGISSLPGVRDQLGITDTAVTSLSLSPQLSNWTWRNEMQWLRSKRQLKVHADIAYLFTTQTADTTGFAQFGLGVEQIWQLSDDASATASVQMAIHRDDIDYRIMGEWQSPKWNVDLSYARRSPDLAMRSISYATDHLNRYNLSASDELKLQGELRNIVPGVNVLAKMSSTSNAILPGQFGQPEQLSEALLQASISVHADWHVGLLHGITDLSYQHISSERLLRPEWVLSGELQLPFTLVRDKLDVQLGVNYTLVPSFEVPAYSPLYGTFYRDRGVESQMIISLEPYARFDIQSFHFYIKGVNSMTPILGITRAWAQDYPIYDYRIAFGAMWRFLD